MRKILARCDEAAGCPLYHANDALEFGFVTVWGAEFVPVCQRAVAALLPSVERLRAGAPAANHARTYCGGCDAGKAWFSFATETAVTSFRVKPQFEHFALNALQKTKVFAGVRPAVLERIVPFMRERRVLDEEVILRQGETGPGLFIIVVGQFDVVHHDAKGSENHLATLGTGDCFGEMSLITGEPVSATVVSRTIGELVEIPRDSFFRVLSIVPTVGVTLARILAQRLARASTSLMEELRKGMGGRLDMVQPVELIQALNVNAQSGRLVVQDGRKSASLHLTEGQVVDVACDGLKGEEALYAFLGWTRGTFRFEMGAAAPERTVVGDTVGLLIEGMRRLDEQRREASGGSGGNLLDSLA